MRHTPEFILFQASLQIKNRNILKDVLKMLTQFLFLCLGLILNSFAHHSRIFLVTLPLQKYENGLIIDQSLTLT